MEDLVKFLNNEIENAEWSYDSDTKEMYRAEGACEAYKKVLEYLKEKGLEI